MGERRADGMNEERYPTKEELYPIKKKPHGGSGGASGKDQVLDQVNIS